MSNTESRTALALALWDTADKLLTTLTALSQSQKEYASLVAIQAVSEEHMTPEQRKRLGVSKGVVKQVEPDASAGIALLLRLWNAWQED